MVCTCSKCSRAFECSELYSKMVKAGKIEAECAYCSGEHNEGDNNGNQN